MLETMFRGARREDWHSLPGDDAAVLRVLLEEVAAPPVHAAGAHHGSRDELNVDINGDDAVGSVEFS